MQHVPHPNAPLGWLALSIAAIGGTVSVLLWMDKLNTGHRQLAGLALAATVIGIGICAISASAQWWLRR